MPPTIANLQFAVLKRKVLTNNTGNQYHIVVSYDECHVRNMESDVDEDDFIDYWFTKKRRVYYA